VHGTTGLASIILIAREVPAMSSRPASLTLCALVCLVLDPDGSFAVELGTAPVLEGSFDAAVLSGASCHLVVPLAVAHCSPGGP